MKYRFFCTHNSIETELFPYNFINDKFVYEKTEGEIFFRLKLSGKLIFGNDIGKPDFTYFKTIEDGVDRCLEISIRIERSCDKGLTYSVYWNGYFAVNDGKFDLDNCIYEIEPKIDDAYRCILEASDKEINILDVPTNIVTTAVIVNNFEFYSCRGADTIADLKTICSATLPAPIPTWKQFHEDTNAVDNIVIYYREITITACVGGVKQTPSGSGWEPKTDNCAINGTAIYVRYPTSSYPIPNLNVKPGNCVPDGMGGYISSEPPINKTLVVTKTTTPTTPPIQGVGFLCSTGLPGLPKEADYEVINNPGSTYAWSVTAGTASVISGAGTNKVRIRVTNFGDVTIQVIETTICGARPAVTKTIAVNNTTPVKPIIYGREVVCPNETGVQYSMYYDADHAFAINWTVPTGATITAGQGTMIITVSWGTTSGDVQASLHGNCLPGQFSSLPVVINKVADIPDIVGLTSVCPSSTGIYYIPPVAGSTYLWTISGGTITSGQGTNQITVTWGTSGSGSITLDLDPGCNCLKWINVESCALSGAPSYYWCPPAENLVEYTRNRLLSAVMLYIAQQCCPGVTSIISDFFEINPVGDAPGYIAGDNYVTGDTNKVDHLTISQKSDIIDPLATEAATKGLLTWDDLTTILREVFQVYWFMTGTSVRLEHISYFSYIVGFDLTSPTYSKYIAGTKKYEYLKLKMPKYERYKWMEAANFDFVGAEIRYDSICVNQKEKDNVSEHNVSNVSTDLSFINSSPNDISKEGFVIMANGISAGVYSVLEEVGLLSGLSYPNNHLSWANLHYNYHRHKRVLLQGNMNLVATTFLSAILTKKQVAVTFPLCCNPFDPEKLITTGLGNGQVDKAEISVEDNFITVELLL